MPDAPRGGEEPHLSFPQHELPPPWRGPESSDTSLSVTDMVQILLSPVDEYEGFGLALVRLLHVSTDGPLLYKKRTSPIDIDAAKRGVELLCQDARSALIEYRRAVAFLVRLQSMRKDLHTAQMGEGPLPPALPQGADSKSPEKLNPEEKEIMDLIRGPTFLPGKGNRSCEHVNVPPDRLNLLVECARMLPSNGKTRLLKVLEVVLRYPEGVSMEALRAQTGYSSSTLRNTLTALRSHLGDKVSLSINDRVHALST